LGRGIRGVEAALGTVMKKWAAWALPCLVIATGCATRYIPNTDVEDNDENRRIIAFCEKYRHAVEERNVPLLLGMASSSYFEDGGNVDAADDMDYAGLREYLEGRFKDTRAIRYEIRYRRIGRGKEDKIFVDFTYTASFRIPGLKGDEWRHTVSDNRLELVADQAAYKIIAGM
jgi:hypothetical protein